MIDLQKKYEGRIWLKACEVKEITHFSCSTLLRYRHKGIIKCKRNCEGGNFLYWYEDVKKIMGWQ